MLRLKPKEEALLLCYVLFFDRCTYACRLPIADLIRTYGTPTTRTVYRGQTNSVIWTNTPFFSASPTRAMAEGYAQNNTLFRIHLNEVPCLSTRSVHYTLSDDVMTELRKWDGNAALAHPKVKHAIFQKRMEEVLVLNGGTFYADAARKRHGFETHGTFKETWYDHPFTK